MSPSATFNKTSYHLYANTVTNHKNYHEQHSRKTALVACAEQHDHSTGMSTGNEIYGRLKTCLLSHRTYCVYRWKFGKVERPRKYGKKLSF